MYASISKRVQPHLLDFTRPKHPRICAPESDLLIVFRATHGYQKPAWIGIGSRKSFCFQSQRRHVKLFMSCSLTLAVRTVTDPCAHRSQSFSFEPCHSVQHKVLSGPMFQRLPTTPSFVMVWEFHSQLHYVHCEYRRHRMGHCAKLSSFQGKCCRFF